MSKVHWILHDPAARGNGFQRLLAQHVQNNKTKK